MIFDKKYFYIIKMINKILFLLMYPINLLLMILFFISGYFEINIIGSLIINYKLWIFQFSFKNDINKIITDIFGMYDLGQLIRYNERKFLYHNRYLTQGDPFVLLNGIWKTKNDEVLKLLNNPNLIKDRNIGSIEIGIPECFSSMTPIFNSDNQYKIIRKELEVNLFNFSKIKKFLRKEKEINMILQNNLNDYANIDRSLLCKVCTLLLFLLLFEQEINSSLVELCVEYERNRLFSLMPKFIHKMLFNFFSIKISKIRSEISNQISEYLDFSIDTISNLDLSILLSDILLFAGVNGSTHLVNACYTKLKEDNKFIQMYLNNNIGFIKEISRHDPPVTSFSTINPYDQEHIILGQKRRISKGTPIMGVISLANMDPDVFEHPDEFDVNRDFSKLVSWNGFGPRKCPGQDISLIICKKIIDYLVFNILSIKYQIITYTGDISYAGTDSNIYITLIGEINTSSKILLDNKYLNDFNRNTIDIFNSEIKYLGKIRKIVIENQNIILKDALYLRKIEIKYLDQNLLFPIYDWIDNQNPKLEIFESTYYLPQYDLNSQYDRKKDLLFQKDKYQFSNYDKLIGSTEGLPPHVKILPRNELTLGFEKDISSTIIDIIGNISIKYLVEKEIKSLDDYYSLSNIPNILVNNDDIRISGVNLKEWDTDLFFGYQRLNGMNPMLIRRLNSIGEYPKKCKIQDRHLNNFKINDLIDQHRLYICNYEELDNIESVFYDNEQRYYHTPIVLLYLNDLQQMMPLAIQISQASDSLIFTPDDNYYDWLFAKICVNNADFILHQFKYHAFECHFILEPIYIFMNRNLSVKHPLYKLLKPHSKGLLHINRSARGSLISKEGDKRIKAMAGNITSIGSYGNKQLIINCSRSYKFDNRFFLNDLKSRNMIDHNINYYYYDDGLLIYESIKSYIEQMIDTFYQNDREIVDDYELQNFIDEIISDGNINFDRSIKDKNQLKELITNIIFISTGQHSVINFAQLEYGGVIAVNPGMLRKKMPLEKNLIDEKFIVDALPSKKWSLIQIGLIIFLSQNDEIKLGDIEYDLFSDSGVKKIINNFQKDLKQTSIKIKERNKKRSYEYPYFLPENILNSTWI